MSQVNPFLRQVCIRKNGSALEKWLHLAYNAAVAIYSTSNTLSNPVCSRSSRQPSSSSCDSSRISLSSSSNFDIVRN